MITEADATEFLALSQGVRIASAILSASIAKVGAAEAGMVSAGYAAHDITLMQTYAVAIVACASQPRRIASEGSPAGNRSFKLHEQWLQSLRRKLLELDTKGVLADVVGADPAAPAGFMIALGGGSCT